MAEKKTSAKGGEKKAPEKKADKPADAKAKAPKVEAKPKAEAAPKAEAKTPKPEAKAAPQAAPHATDEAHSAHMASTHARHGFRRTLIGRVTSDKMNKTVTVEVIRNSLDPVYKKYVRGRERYKAHDETNQYKIGDRVEIQEHRPISREKRWMVTKLIARPVEE